MAEYHHLYGPDGPNLPAYIASEIKQHKEGVTYWRKALADPESPSARCQGIRGCYERYLESAEALLANARARFEDLLPADVLEDLFAA
jgi:hypothetical protein